MTFHGVILLPKGQFPRAFPAKKWILRSLVIHLVCSRRMSHSVARMRISTQQGSQREDYCFAWSSESSLFGGSP